MYLGSTQIEQSVINYNPKLPYYSNLGTGLNHSFFHLNSSKFTMTLDDPMDESKPLIKPISYCQTLLLGLYQAYKERDSIFLGKFYLCNYFLAILNSIKSSVKYFLSNTLKKPYLNCAILMISTS